MCGFLGEVLLNDNGSFICDKTFSSLLELSKHRGPDDTQILRGENYRLGFNRLSILDLSQKGSQPKQSPSKRYSVVFNGELYNYKKLAQTFEIEIDDSNSDTLVLVNLLDKIGVTKTIKQLNGMFSIVVVDTKDDSTYLIRDFAGIKPLFYGMSKKGLLVASQFNQILKHPWFSDYLQLRPEAVKSYFGLGYMLAPDTIYQAIFQVQAGQYIKIDNSGDIEKYTYSNFNSDKSVFKNPDINLLTGHLDKAVNLQLASDVSLGSFLSGGIDSPLITALAKQNKSDLAAFTLSVSDKLLDESHEAKSYAKHIGCRHHIEKVKSETICNEINNHFKYLTEPFGDYSSIPTYLITKIAKKKHTVMLSGDGGDELFLGYPRMLRIVKLRYWFKIPFLIRRPLIRIAIKLGLLKSWLPYNFNSIGDAVLHQQIYISNNRLNSILPKHQYTQEVNKLFSFNKRFSKKNVVSWLRDNEFKGHLQRVLIKVDRMSMANSLEVRVPFLEKQFLNEAFKTLPKTYNRYRDLKAPLKKIVSLFYLKNVINNQKKGFAVPIETWLKNELKADVINTVFELPLYGSEILNIPSVKLYVNDFYEEKHNEAWGVWHIYAWQKWAINEGLI